MSYMKFPVKFHGTYGGIVDVENQGIVNFSLKREDFPEKLKTCFKKDLQKE